MSKKRQGTLTKKNRTKKQNQARLGPNSRPSNKNAFVEKFSSISLVPSAMVSGKKAASTGGGLRMSKCGLKYALALSDPFNPAARGACIPHGGAPSGKMHAINRFDVIIGTAGVGIVVLTPCLSNDLPSGFYTTAAFTGTQAAPLATGGTFGAAGTASTLNVGWQNFNMPGPFTTNQLIAGAAGIATVSNTVEGRIVACGIRAQYTGTTLNESGLFYCYHDLAHLSLSGVNANDLGTFGDTNITGVSRTPCCQAAFGCSETEIEFSGLNPAVPTTQGGVLSVLYPFSAGNNQWAAVYNGTSRVQGIGIPGGSTYGFPLGCPICVMLVTGVAGQSVHIEMISHYEFQGAGAQGMLTPSTSDATSVFACRTAAMSLPAMKLASPDKSPWTLMYEGLKTVVKATVPVLVPLAEKALMAALL